MWIRVFKTVFGVIGYWRSRGVGSLIGWPITLSIAIGAAISLASTMVLSRLLMDRGELHSAPGTNDHGRDAVLFHRDRLWQSSPNPRPGGHRGGES